MLEKIKYTIAGIVAVVLLLWGETIVDIAVKLIWG